MQRRKRSKPSVGSHWETSDSCGYNSSSDATLLVEPSGQSIRPEDHSILSKLLFCWVWPLLSLRLKRPLTSDDIPEVQDSIKCDIVGQRLVKEWEKESNVGEPNLRRVLLKVFWLDITYQGALYVLSQSLQIWRSLLLRYFLLGYNSNTNEMSTWGLGLGIILTSGFNLVITNSWNFLSSELGLKMSNGLTALIFHKTLHLSSRGLTNTSDGQLVNLVSNDVKRFETRVGIIHALWVGPLTTAVSIVIFVIYCPVATVGVGVLGILILISSWLLLDASRLLSKISTKRDARLKVINELVSSIREIKMYCWEMIFEHKLNQVRREEIQHLRNRWLLWAVYRTNYVMSTRLVVFVTLTTLLLVNGTVNTEDVFLIICLYSTVAKMMSQAFISALYTLTNINLSVSRCQDFLILSEHPFDPRTCDEIPQECRGSVTVENLTASRNLNEPPVLSNITLTAASGNPLIVVGPVGSGKSTLFSALIGNLETIQGSIRIQGSLAYVSQTHWTFNATIRDNIVFGRAYNMDWYKQVIDACALGPDFKPFSNSDQEVVGDNGISLSGGQKMRISLARAVYANQDIYLLDNILSVLDAQVGAHIFTQVVFGLLKSKCVIMATSNLRSVQSQNGIYIENGRITETSTVKQLCRDKPFLLQNIENRPVGTSAASVTSWSEPTVTKSEPRNDGSIETESSQDPVGLSVLKQYLSSINRPTLIILAAGILLLFQICQNFTDMTLRMLTEDTQSDEAICRYKLYAMLTLANILLGLSGLILFYNLCTFAGKTLHDNAFQAMLHAKTKFFGGNTTGSILNLFSTDMGSIDDYLPQVIEAAVSSVLQVLGILIVAVYLNQLLLIPSVVLALAFPKLRQFYLKPASDLRWMEAQARSPVYTHFNATLNGLVTIRTLNAERFFVQTLYRLKDKHSAIDYTFLSVFNWFIFYIDVLMLLFSTLTVTSFMVFPTDSASAGLAIALIFSADNIISYGMQQTAELGNELVSVKRLLGYGKLPTESDKCTYETFETIDGDIEFKNVDVAYTEGTLALQWVNVVIKAREKVGIVGRTGSGKSTFMSCLLRLIDPVSGTVSIDGIDIQTLNLKHLRSSISVIPQFPLLLQGTVRYNLDVHRRHTDADLVKVLVDVGFSLGPNGLDAAVQSGGTNYSHGERQLLALGRALLSNNKILVLDEITANVDKKTEEKIRDVIDKKFVNFTVISISHSLRLVIHYDKIVVLEAGQVLEYDTARALLADADSTFSRLIRTEFNPTLE